MLTIKGYDPEQNKFFSVTVTPEIAAKYPQSNWHIWFPQQVLNGQHFNAVDLMVGEGLVSPTGQCPLEMIDEWNEELALRIDRPTWALIRTPIVPNPVNPNVQRQDY